MAWATAVVLCSKPEAPDPKAIGRKRCKTMHDFKVCPYSSRSKAMFDNFSRSYCIYEL